MDKPIIKNREQKRRIIEFSYKHKLSHLGSCLTAYDIIDEIFSIKKPDERFILSSGHAGVALYAAVEKFFSKPMEEIWGHHQNIHPDYCAECHIDCSTGSLGQGLPIAVGMALSDIKREKKVYCLVSDGETEEGSFWEALHIWHRSIYASNLKIYLNVNGWGAYQKIDKKVLYSKLENHIVSVDLLLNWRETNVEQFPFLKGQNAHYAVMSEKDYKIAMEILK